MKSLKMECLHKETEMRNQMAFEKTPDYIDSVLIDKFKGEYIVKTPLWAIQHCLSLPNPSTKNTLLRNPIHWNFLGLLMEHLLFVVLLIHFAGKVRLIIAGLIYPMIQVTILFH